ncbi:Protein FAR1-RELATED SEQUENCE 5 [Linum perenne]
MWSFFYQSVESTSVTHVFMDHPEAVKLYRAYPYVVLLDSTYKTNRYGYPLVELIGIIPVRKSFTIAYVIMKYESIDSYKWVLEKLKMLVEEDSVPNVIVTDRELGLLAAIKETFPQSVHLLCIWHLECCGNESEEYSKRWPIWKKYQEQMVERCVGS